MRKRPGKNITKIHFIAVFLLTAGNLFAATSDLQKNPNPAKGCAICHYRWIDTFFIEGKGTDLVPYQSEKVVAKPEMCISCHDGSVKDSRARILHGSQHKTDVKPPADMKIPDIFPLDEEGKVQCATCHTAHGVESGPGIKETIFLRTSNKNSAMCILCHPDKGGGTKAGNHSLGKGEKAVPKSLLMLGAHKGSEKNQMICETCHTAHGSKREGYLVKTAGDSSLCIDCHAEMNMFDRSGKRNANHAINVKPQLATIEETLHQKGGKLGDNGVITCQTCHKIHNNKIKQPMLLLQDNRKSDICLTCHPDKRRLENTKHNLSVSAKEEKNLEGETPGESGMCSACHLPHKAARKPFMKRADTDRTTAQCLSCHAKGMVAENKKLDGYLHPVDIAFSQTTDAKNNEGRMMVRPKGVLDLPLYNKLGVMDKKGKITCATCHDTHGGAIVQDVPKIKTGGVNQKTTLLRKASPEICKPCHAEKFAVEKTRHDLNPVFPQMSPVMKQKLSKPDLCLNCHNIHSTGADGYKWPRKITADNGKVVTDMCTDCHDKDGLAPKMTVKENSHPVNLPLTSKMKPAALPLFNADGEKTKNGIMTCYTCHDPHRGSPMKSVGSAPPALEDRSVNPFLRIDIAPGSDLCVSCHGDKEDLLQTDHNLVMTAPEAKNITGRKPGESGACGVCHLVHNSKERIALWAQDLSGKDDIPDGMCVSCHSPKGAAAKKIPQIASHPATYFISDWKIGGTDLPVFPLYDKKTARLIKNGDISCLSCHDAHHWMVKPKKTNGSNNAIGNATTSFLRPHLPDKVCRTCHGFDALYRFKYFHKADKRNLMKPPKFQNKDINRSTNIHYTGKHCNECHEKTPVPGGATYLKFGGDYGKLCRCHFMDQADYIHPNDITPSDEKKKQVPKEFPLENGKVTCLTCHDIYLQCRKQPFEKNSLRGYPYPSRTDFCYKCHIKGNYQQTDPHLQLNEKGEIIIGACLICHKDKPDEKHATFKDVTFVGDIEQMCRRCHRIAGNHSGNTDHMKKVPSAKGLKRIKAMEKKFNVRLPLNENGKMTCITCHNPHQKGVIPTESPGARGAGSKYRHRLPENICKECHQM